MEDKIKVENGVGRYVNPNKFIDMQFRENYTVYSDAAANEENLVFEQFEQYAKENEFATDAPDGVYDADMFGDEAWQGKPKDGKFWHALSLQPKNNADISFAQAIEVTHPNSLIRRYRPFLGKKPTTPATTDRGETYDFWEYSPDNGVTWYPNTEINQHLHGFDYFEYYYCMMGNEYKVRKSTHPQPDQPSQQPNPLIDVQQMYNEQTIDGEKPLCGINCRCKSGNECYGEAALNLIEYLESKQPSNQGSGTKQEWQVLDESFPLGETGVYGCQLCLTNGTIKLFNYQDEIEFETLVGIAEAINATQNTATALAEAKQTIADRDSLIKTMAAVGTQINTELAASQAKVKELESVIKEIYEHTQHRTISTLPAIERISRTSLNIELQ